MIMNTSSIITSVSQIEDIVNIIWIYQEENYIKIELDGKNISDKNEFISEIYDHLKCPKTFWKNWDAFWDTIRDSQFWVKKPLILIFKNYNSIFWINKSDRYILSDIIIDMIKLKNQKYYIFLLEE